MDFLFKKTFETFKRLYLLEFNTLLTDQESECTGYSQQINSSREEKFFAKTKK
jgi:hypothetical protein